VKDILQQMNLPQHAAQAVISSTIRMIEKYGTDGLLCSRCKKNMLQ
jgi:chitinase